MKKKLLSLAVVSALGSATVAQAVYVNPDNLGEVLLFPYYTVQNGFVTSVHVVNTTSAAKAVKVRVLEGKNSQEVLDFNLYLSPNDVWAGLITNDEANGAKISSPDNSCTAPRQLGAAGEPFRTFRFQSEVNNDPDDPGALDRRREGYVELIEMGELNQADQIAAVTHDTTGIPANCSLIQSADAAGTVTVDPPTGNMFGSGHLIAVDSGYRTSYDAVALDAFSDRGLWTPSGVEEPSLNSVSPAIGNIIDGIDTIDFAPAFLRPNVDAVSAILTHASIANEYVIDAGRESMTDWIVTFPTKRFYVNPPDTLDPSPFQRAWDPDILRADHDVSFIYFDREERGQEAAGGDFSPVPPTAASALPYEVNTLTLFRSDADVEESRLFGAQSTAAELRIEQGFEAGWMSLGFRTGVNFGFLVSDDDDGTVVEGLPVIGFSAMSNINKVTVEVDGLQVFSAYMGSTVHKGDRVIGQIQ